MGFQLGKLNWVAVVAAVVVGQILSTVWFVALFGEAWAQQYGVASAAEHTAQIPPYTYAVGLLCTTLLTLGIAMLQRMVGVSSVADGLKLGLFIAVLLSLATLLPGQMFLGRFTVFLIAGGSQLVMILGISAVLAAFPAKAATPG